MPAAREASSMVWPSSTLMERSPMNSIQYDLEVCMVLAMTLKLNRKGEQLRQMFIPWPNGIYLTISMQGINYQLTSSYSVCM
jgi:hypothetical protein